MKIGVEYLVICKVVVQLLKDQPFQNLTQRGQDSHRSIVLGKKLTILFVKRDYFSILPAGGELLLEYRQGDNVVQGSSNDIS